MCGHKQWISTSCISLYNKINLNPFPHCFIKLVVNVVRWSPAGSGPLPVSPHGQWCSLPHGHCKVCSVCSLPHCHCKVCRVCSLPHGHCKVCSVCSLPHGHCKVCSVCGLLHGHCKVCSVCGLPHGHCKVCSVYTLLPLNKK